MAEVMYFKRGDTFRLSCTTDQDITGFSIASQVRTSAGGLIDTLVVNLLQANPTGSFTLDTTNNTSGWPIGTLYCDIQYTTGSGEIVSTETFEIDVIRDITQ